jgi:hypothetical protein
MKRIFLATICTLSALSAYGQTQTAAPTISPCTLKVAQAPAVRGVKLGMKIEEVLALFPGSSETEWIKRSIAKPDGDPNFGVVGFAISPSLYANKERFNGIDSFSFMFLDGRMVQYDVEYGPPAWPRLDDFIAKVTDAFRLPPVENRTGNLGRKSLNCEEFHVNVSSRDGRAILTAATNDEPAKIRMERRVASEEKARREFKP